MTVKTWLSSTGTDALKIVLNRRFATMFLTICSICHVLSNICLHFWYTVFFSYFLVFICRLKFSAERNAIPDKGPVCGAFDAPVFERWARFPSQFPTLLTTWLLLTGPTGQSVFCLSRHELTQPKEIQKPSENSIKITESIPRHCVPFHGLIPRLIGTKPRGTETDPRVYLSAYPKPRGTVCLLGD